MHHIEISQSFTLTQENEGLFKQLLMFLIILIDWVDSNSLSKKLEEKLQWNLLKKIFYEEIFTLKSIKAYSTKCV